MSTFNEIAAEKGWSKDEQIAVLLEFAQTHADTEEFESFFAGQKGYSDGSQNYEIVALWPDEGSWCEDVRATSQEDAMELAKDLMADNSCITFDDDAERQAFKDSITIVTCI